MGDKEQLLHDIGIVGFVLVELALYLDTHPFDRDAMEYFNHYSRIKQQMTNYPLTLGMAESGKEWRWGAAPLPWEGECV